MAETVVKHNLESKIDHSAAWSWEDSHVAQAYVDPTSSSTGLSYQEGIAINDIVESGSVLIAAGPADLSIATDPQKNPGAGYNIVPIGLVETAQISMNKPLSRIFEIGSKLSYLIPGRTVGGITLSRVFFDGPSLLKALYMGEVEADYATADVKKAKFVSNQYYEGGQKAYLDYANIGSGNLAMNLASSFFEQPVGLAFLFKDQNSDTVGQTYFEGCRVSTYNIGISANMNVLTESVNMEFIRCRPINTKATYEWVDPSSLEGGAPAQLFDKNIVSNMANQGTL